MAKDQAGTEVNIGDEIAVRARGIEVRGKVERAHWWGESGWDIEITDANVSGGYSRWKQWDDGGKIVKVNGRTIL